MTRPIILLGLVLSFQTSPTTSDEWTREPKMAIFDQNAKPPPEISKGHWGYTWPTSGYSYPSRSKLLKYTWLKSNGSIGMQPEHQGGGP